MLVGFSTYPSASHEGLTSFNEALGMSHLAPTHIPRHLSSHLGENFCLDLIASTAPPTSSAHSFTPALPESPPCPLAPVVSTHPLIISSPLAPHLRSWYNDGIPFDPSKEGA